MIKKQSVRFYLFTLLCGTFFLLIGPHSLSAQAGLGAAGAHVATESFNFSYSVGQVFNYAIKQSDYYVSQGIQHPKLMVLSDTPPVGEAAVQMHVYPNPVAHELHIRLDHAEITGCVLQLLNMKGQVLTERFVESKEYILPMGAYHAGHYMLRLHQEESAPRTFKIIKTQ